MALTEHFIAQQAKNKRDAMRLLLWLRREVNRDLALFRRELKASSGNNWAGLEDRIKDRIADCQAKRAMIRWALSWQARDNMSSDPHLEFKLEMDREMIMYGIRYVALAYRNREGYRDEWVIGQ